MDIDQLIISYINKVALSTKPNLRIHFCINDFSKRHPEQIETFVPNKMQLEIVDTLWLNTMRVNIDVH